VARGIDHLVPVVRDLDKAREVYSGLGFTCTPKGQHDWGTANFLVQLDGSFIEVLTVDRPELLVDPKESEFSFGRFAEAFLQRGQGFAMLVLESTDRDGDLQDFRSRGLKVYDPFGFSRRAVLPSGEAVTVSFSLAFVGDAATPDICFFTCQQHAPQYFWKKEYQSHPNTALTVTEVAMVSDDPKSHVEFLSGFSGSDTVTTRSDEIIIETPRGRIAVQTPARSTEIWGEPNPVFDAPYLRGFRIAVADLSAAKKCAGDNGLSFVDRDREILFPASEAMGTAIILEQA
jgi:catechol 2,3-dioxygenase-like lactoylglutathione lyase family enzyme